MLDPLSMTNCAVEVWNNKDYVVQLSKANIYALVLRSWNG